jgi:hypothetical protein
MKLAEKRSLTKLKDKIQTVSKAFKSFTPASIIFTTISIHFTPISSQKRCLRPYLAVVFKNKTFYQLKKLNES